MSRHAQLTPPIPYDPVRLLRPTDVAFAQLACRARAGPSDLRRGDALLVSSDGGSGASAVLIIASPHSAGPKILHALPITSRFKLALNQTPPSPSTSFFHQSSRPHIILILNSGDVKVDLRLSSRDSVKTQAFVAELKRRVIQAKESKVPRYLSHAWLRFYPVRSPPSLLDEDDFSPSASTSALASPTESEHTLTNPFSALGFASSASLPSQDEEFPNPFLPTFDRTAFLRKRVFAQQEQWSSREPLRIRLATYNVNDKLPPRETVELAPLVGTGDEDILVFGFQEVDLRSTAMLVSQGASRADEWAAALLRGLGEKGGKFEKIAVMQYVGVMTIVFARKELREAISQVQTSERGIGLLGFGGNKAGVAVRLKVHDTALCFMNSHLAAFASALDRRRSDYQTLLKGLSFDRLSGRDMVPALEELLPDHPDRLLGVEDSHALFWLGDLNYRIVMEDDILRAWVKEQRWQALLEKDQLCADIVSGKSFAGFDEGTIAFPPTYKYVHGSATLDVRRAPAYTDRILWSTPEPPFARASPSGLRPASSPTASVTSPVGTPSRPTLVSRSSSNIDKLLPRTPSELEIASRTTAYRRHPVKCTSYISHEIFWSDHRPVSATVETEVRVADVEKRAECLAAATREIERLEEVYRPNLQVIEDGVQLGIMSYRCPGVQALTLRNTGRVPANFSFRPPAPGKPFCKPFISVFPHSGCVPPGEDWTIWVVACVSEVVSARLTLEEDMNDVLVLQVADGKDTVNSFEMTKVTPLMTQFITVQADFAPTIVGMPLALLPSLPGPIRTLSLAQRKALRSMPGSESAIAINPKTATPPTSFKMQSGVGVDVTENPAINDSEAKQDGRTGAAVAPTRDGPTAASTSQSVDDTYTASEGQLEKVMQDPEASSNAQNRTAKPAKEIWRLLEYLMEYGVGIEGLWYGDTDEADVLGVIESLDTGEVLARDAAVAVSITLLHILCCLPEPLLPRQLQAACLQSTERDEAFASLEGMPGVNTNVLIGLMSVARLCSQPRSSVVSPDDLVGQGDEVVAEVEMKRPSALFGLDHAVFTREERMQRQVDALAAAVFGDGSRVDSVGRIEEQEGRRRFVRLMLDG